MNVKIGQTKVNVIQMDERGQSRQIHRGIVIGANDSFLRVFNAETSLDKGGDINVFASQWYAINAPRSRCEIVGETKTPIFVPANL